MGVSRREFLIAGGGFLATTAGLAAPVSALGGTSRYRARAHALPGLREPALRPEQVEALRVLGRTSLRMPDTRPFAALPEGTDTMPQIEHVIVAMMENHSYDNLLGMLGRGPFETPRGDGFTIAADGYPTAWNPDGRGGGVRAFHMPTTCQFDGVPAQDWLASHAQYAGGAMNGFVTSASGPVSMGYWTAADLPFTYALAATFPLGDRYFCSLLGQTDPNRRYVIAGTSCGMTDDIPLPEQDATLLVAPANGTIYSRMASAGISFMEYYEQYPSQTAATMNLYPTVDAAYSQGGKTAPMTRFYADCAAGSLPQFSFLGPNFSTQSQENPQNIVIGEAWLRRVVEAIGASPKWSRTVLIVNYDEHGGYYDHVPPPVALAPDDIPPVTDGGEPAYDGFTRYGFRVPCIVVSPYAKRDHVSSVVYDHGSVLAFVERKWNLPAITLRDANANDLTDFLDLPAMAAGRPTFPELPALAPSGDTPAAEACSRSGPGTVPVADAPALPVLIRFGRGRLDRPRHAWVVPVRASRQLSACAVELWRGRHRIAHTHLGGLGVETRHVALRSGRRAPAPGRYTLVVKQGATVLGRRAVRIA
jgi:phospholipase C